MTGYWSRTLLGVAIVAGSVALASLSLYHLVRTGSCGTTTSSYSSLPACPDGTGLKVLGLIGATFVTPFLGMGLLHVRRPGAGGGSAWGIGVVWFLLLFACMGAAALVAGHGPAAPTDEDTRSAATWVGVTFLLMGAPALLVVLAGTARVGVRRRQKAVAAPAATDRAATSVLREREAVVARMEGKPPVPRRAQAPDPVAARLRELDELRSGGLLTAEEHAAKRAQILADL